MLRNFFHIIFFYPLRVFGLPPVWSLMNYWKWFRDSCRRWELLRVLSIEPSYLVWSATWPPKKLISSLLSFYFFKLISGLEIPVFSEKDESVLPTLIAFSIFGLKGAVDPYFFSCAFYYYYFYCRIYFCWFITSFLFILTENDEWFEAVFIIKYNLFQLI